MLELIKELCEPKDGVGSIPPSPAVDHIDSIALPGTSGLAHQARKRKECQFVACRNKSSSFLPKLWESMLWQTHIRKSNNRKMQKL